MPVVTVLHAHQQCQETFAHALALAVLAARGNRQPLASSYRFFDWAASNTCQVGDGGSTGVCMWANICQEVKFGSCSVERQSNVEVHHAAGPPPETYLCFWNALML